MTSKAGGRARCDDQTVPSASVPTGPRRSKRASSPSATCPFATGASDRSALCASLGRALRALPEMVVQLSGEKYGRRNGEIGRPWTARPFLLQARPQRLSPAKILMLRGFELVVVAHRPVQLPHTHGNELLPSIVRGWGGNVPNGNWRIILVINGLEYSCGGPSPEERRRENLYIACWTQSHSNSATTDPTEFRSAASALYTPEDRHGLPKF